jgi:hypothetical protein
LRGVIHDSTNRRFADTHAYMPLSADDIRTAFAALADELNAEIRHAEVVIAGGAALVLLYGARQTAKDVDCVLRAARDRPR